MNAKSTITEVELLTANGESTCTTGTEELWKKKEKTIWMATFIVGNLCLYAARSVLPISVVSISKQYNWSKTDTGIVLSSFFWGYVLTQVPGGYLSDHYGGETLLLLGTTAWSLLTFCLPETIWFSHHDSRGPGIFVIFSRIATGAFQGFHYPAVTSITAKYLPTSETTFFISATSSGATLGCLLVGSLGSVIIEHYGWVYVFRFFGILGITWVIFLRYLSTTKISDKSSFVNQQLQKTVMSTNLPWTTLLKSKAFWAMLIAQITEDNCFYILISWLPVYFSENFPQGKGWEFNFIPYIITPISSILIGWYIERLIQKGYNLLLIRKFAEAGSQYVRVVILTLIANLHNYEGVLFCVVLCFGVGPFHTAGVHMNPMDIAPRYAGTVFGFMNSIGALPGIFSVYTTGYILDTTNSWKLVFYITAFLNFIGCSLFLLWGSVSPIISSSTINSAGPEL
ncbi:voltage-gated purine nucleotide uniporter SLC17A9-like isoform X2 [Tachypleus tridentatus]